MNRSLRLLIALAPFIALFLGACPKDHTSVAGGPIDLPVDWPEPLIVPPAGARAAQIPQQLDGTTAIDGKVIAEHLGITVREWAAGFTTDKDWATLRSQLESELRSRDYWHRNLIGDPSEHISATYDSPDTQTVVTLSYDARTRIYVLEIDKLDKPMPQRPNSIGQL